MAKVINTITGDNIKVGDVISVLRVNKSMPIDGGWTQTRTMVINSGVVESVEGGRRVKVVIRTDDGIAINYAFSRRYDVTMVYKDCSLIAELYIFSGIINLTQS